MIFALLQVCLTFGYKGIFHWHKFMFEFKILTLKKSVTCKINYYQYFFLCKDLPSNKIVSFLVTYLFVWLPIKVSLGLSNKDFVGLFRLLQIEQSYLIFCQFGVNKY